MSSIDISRIPRTPLTRTQFDALRRDPQWQLTEIYPGTFRAIHREAGQGQGLGGGGFHYLVRRRFDGQYPYALFGPLIGDAMTSPWPAPEDCAGGDGIAAG